MEGLDSVGRRMREDYSRVIGLTPRRQWNGPGRAIAERLGYTGKILLGREVARPRHPPDACQQPGDTGNIAVDLQVAGACQRHDSEGVLAAAYGDRHLLYYR
jgi:hypothetical protein